MAKLYKHVASGTIKTQGQASGLDIEIWACTLHSLQPDSADNITINELFAAAWSTFFQANGTAISGTAWTKSIKSNVIDPQTGLQITDPTVEKEVSYGGGLGGTPATFQTCRISIDNGTRNRRARGGFYLPRFAGAIGGDGRFTQESQAVVATNAANMLESLGVTGGLSNAGVYSKTEAGFFPATRVRVGNVPDVQRRRKNALVEVYSEVVLTP